MDTKITQVNAVEYALEVTATAEELAPAFNKELKKLQAQTTMKGFRPGKVPLGLVKKLYGEALAREMADKSVQEAYEEAVVEPGELDVMGRPTITELDVKVDGDLRAVIQFGVRPEVELKDLSQEQLPKLVHEVTDDDVEEAVTRYLREHADLIPVEEEPAGEEDYVVFDLQETDPATGMPIIGKRDEDQAYFMDDEQLDSNPMLRALRKAILGAKVGDTVRFHFEHDEAHGHHGGGHAHHYMASVKEIKRRDLEELDDDFVKEITEGRIETAEAFREDIRRQLERMWERRARELLENEIVERMLDLHDVLVPTSVVDFILDSYVEDVKRRNEGTWPDTIPEVYFRRANVAEAEQQARWMIIRDKVLKEEHIEVTEDDLDAYFDQEAADDDRLTTEQLKQFYRSMPQLMEGLEHRLLNQKLFDVLAARFQFVEKDWETYREELEARQAEAHAGRHGNVSERSEAPQAAEAAAEAEDLAETSGEEE